MSVTVAKFAGFCFGVDRAVKTVESLLNNGKKVATLGEIIHNTHVVRKFAGQGVRIVNAPEQTFADETVVIRSHGVSASVISELHLLGRNVVDATCPYVARIQKMASEIPNPQTALIIIGDSRHPEVTGIVGHAKLRENIFVAPDSENIRCLNLDRYQNIQLVAQTTCNSENWENCNRILKQKYPEKDIAVRNTICKATVNRQKNTADLSLKCDLMVVIGSPESSNSRKLDEICRKNVRTIMIDGKNELEHYRNLIKQSLKVGLTAGASVPCYIIKEVQQNMNEIQKTPETEEFDFERALEESFKTINTGDKVRGIVTSIAPGEATVDIGTKQTGFLPLEEITDAPGAKITDYLNIGDELDLIAYRVNDVEGYISLSKKRFEAIEGLERIYNAPESGEVFKGTVTNVIKGGIIVHCHGMRVFIPASQATMSRNDSLDELLKKQVEFKILEADRDRRRAVGSIRAVANAKRDELKAKFWESAEEGKVYTGPVKSIISFGVFVDLGGVDGMIPISELSWKRIKSPTEIVQKGDIVEVYIKSLDREKGKVSLGYKKTEDDPWIKFEKEYTVGQKVSVKINTLTSYGAFATIVPGIDGLIHISQVANHRVEKIENELKSGQLVDAEITEISPDKKRVGLSIKALIAAAESAAEPAAESTESAAESTETAAESN